MPFIPDKQQTTFISDKKDSFVADSFIPDKSTPLEIAKKAGKFAITPLVKLPERVLASDIVKTAGQVSPIPVIQGVPILPFFSSMIPPYLRENLGKETLESIFSYTSPLALSSMALGGLASRLKARPFTKVAKPAETVGPKPLLYGPKGEIVSGGEVVGGVENLNPIQKITQLLKEAKPIRREQEALYPVERAKRAAKISEIGERIPGEAGYHAQLGALKGELPKVQFEGIKGGISQPDIDSLFNTIEQAQTLLPYEKITTKTGLAKLLGEKGGTVPTEGELKLLNQVFPKEFIDTVLSKRPLMQKVGQGIAEVLNVPRALMASFDMSAPLRQGVFLVGKPKQFIPAFKDMFKYFFNEKSYQGLMQNIQQRPTYALMREGRLPLTDIGATLTGREEAFMSNLSEKIPLVGKIVRASNRAYTGFLNKLRADVFDDLVKTAQKQGIPVEGKVLNDIAMFVGSATGRGKLPQALERSAITLNSVFFSPRLMASRLNLLNPVYYIKLDPFVRKEALKSLFTFGGTASTILGLTKMGGAEVGVDPRSADFGKIKLGNTRYDILGGFQQYIRIATQLITGEHISSTTGVKTTIGEGYKPLTRKQILTRFIETKEAPIMSFATSLMEGQTYRGEKINLPKEISERFIPMVIQDMKDLYKERGLEGLGMAIPAVFGVGVQTYSATPSETVQSANSVINYYKELKNQKRDQEAEDFLIKNRRIVLTGKALEPYQKVLNELENFKEIVKKNVQFTPQQKTTIMSNINQKIKVLQSAMEERFKQIKNQK